MFEMVLNMLLHCIPLHHGQITAKTFIYVCVWSKQFSLNPFQLSVAFHIETSHLFCTEKQWLVSMWNATLEWNVLSEYLLSWWSEDKTSIPNLKINELFTVQKRNHTSFSCARFAFEFEYLMETAFAYLKALYIWVKADQRTFAGLTFSYILYLRIYKKCLQSKHEKIVQVIKLYHIKVYLHLYANKKLKSLQNILGMVQLLLFWGKTDRGS